MIDSDSDKPISSQLLKSINTSNGITNNNGSVKKEDSDDNAPLSQMISNKPKVSINSEKSNNILPLSSVLKKTSPRPKAKEAIKSESSDDDLPLTAVIKKASSKRKPSIKSESSDDDLPLSTVLKKTSKIKPEESSDDDQPLSAMVKKSTPKNKASIKSESSDDDLPLSAAIKKASSKSKVKKEIDRSPAKPIKKVKAESLSSGLKRKLSSGGKALANKKDVLKAGTKIKAGVKKEIKKEANGDNEDEEEEYKWWLEDKLDDTIRWNTLEHNGVLFPPEYEPINVKLIYNGVPIKLSPASEEVAGFFGAMLNTDHAQNPVFQKNFFSDFLKVLSKNDPDCPIKEFNKCDFKPFLAYYEAEREKKKALTRDEKKAIKAEKDAIDLKYAVAYLDGRKEKVGNFRVEPPGLFRGRGDHPKTGHLKPEQITINIGADAKIPELPPGRHWKSVINNNKVTWLAYWIENISSTFKYVFLAANSSLKTQSDFKKFEKARDLAKCVDKVRANYLKELKGEKLITRQLATATYLIDRLALRAGNEKNDNEADTVGCCSLRCEHITLEAPDQVTFDFLGKDSIRYVNKVTVIPQAYKNLAYFKVPPKKPTDDLFDKIETTALNKYLSNLMPGLSAKVFRTFNASYTFQIELQNTPKDGTINEKILAYNRSNRQVAILCNHQRAVSKNFDGQMERMDDKIKALYYDQYRLKQQILKMEPKLKKKRPELQEKNEELTDEWCTEHIQTTSNNLREKAKLKYEKDLAELKTKADKTELKEKLNAKLKDINEDEKIMLKEIKSGKVSEPKRATAVDKMLERLDKLTERIKNAELSKVDKDENKTTALGTSKINYIDPRITVSWCKKFQVPVEKMFNKTLQEKFKWAMDADADFVF